MQYLHLTSASHAEAGKGYDPSSWAKQRQAAIARAQAIRAERNKGEDITEEHTFTPNTVSVMSCNRPRQLLD